MRAEPQKLVDSIKEALVLLGKMQRAVVRPPLVKVTPAEIERIRQALVRAELLPAEARRPRVAAAG